MAAGDSSELWPTMVDRWGCAPEGLLLVRLAGLDVCPGLRIPALVGDSAVVSVNVWQRT